MPNVIAAPIFSFLISSTAIATTLAGPLATALGYAIFAGGVYLASSFFMPKQQKPKVPEPGDGSYNLKQNVPSRAYVLGRVKKGGDYVFLESDSSRAYHIIVWASHRIEGFVTHYSHDKSISVDGSGAVTSHHLLDGSPCVAIFTRNGLNAETAYSTVSAAFPSIWNSNCRGDGLASVFMFCNRVPLERYTDVYPNQMPEWSAVGNGALLYDPRKDSTQGGSGSHRTNNPATWEFSRNIALMRLWHLCHPVGGKMSYDDMHMPDWINAANVCDQFVTNRSGGTERRYWGGFWFQANNDPIEVARVMDDAAELVVFERSNGKIGVHAGEFVEPDFTISERHIFALQLDKNRRLASNVLAVRGRYINTANAYNTEDAAIYGNPYGLADDTTERTKTFENAAVQSHNHCQRKQKITFIRANARKISVSVDFTDEDMRKIPERRFVRVHYPRRGLVNAVVEITSSPSIDLRRMRISFSGIVVPETLYDFNAAVEEGAPGAVATILPPVEVSEPTGFSATVETEVLAGGSTAAYLLGSWDAGPSSVSYEMEFERVTGSTGPSSVFIKAGSVQARTPNVADGVQYKIRLRAWAGGRSSDWTDYETLTTTADPTPPAVVTGADAIGDEGSASYVWTAPNSANYAGARLYINTVDSFTGATLLATEYGAPNAVDGRTFAGLDADTYYGFVVAINASGVPATAVPTGQFIVT
ncbi:MAG: hypothetical protein ACK4SQ_15980 [Allorhizobium sp.]